MTNEQEEEKVMPEEYRCIKYDMLEACRTCDGFGRNLDDKIDTNECYSPDKNEIKPFRRDYELFIK
jgi:hypothetical protein